MENMNLKNIEGKHVLIVGLGKSGIAAAQAMLKLGAVVSIQDSKTPDKVDGQLISFLTGLSKGQDLGLYLGVTPPDMSEFDIMILSPGVDPELPFVREAEEEGVEIIGELEIAYRIGRGHFIGITGSSGRSAYWFRRGLRSSSRGSSGFPFR